MHKSKRSPFDTNNLRKLSKDRLIEFIQVLHQDFLELRDEYRGLKAAEITKIECSVFMAGCMIIRWYNLREEHNDQKPNPSFAKKELRDISKNGKGPFQYSFDAVQKPITETWRNFKNRVEARP